VSRLRSAFGVALVALGVGAATAEATGVRRVGVLSLRASGPSAGTDALLEGLRTAGYVVGRNLAVEYRFADGDRARLQALARELVATGVEVIVTERGPATRAAQAATPSVPIIMVGSSDPIGTGIAASLARPGGNVTGLTLDSTEISGKRLQLLKEIVPRMARVAVLYNATDPGKAPELQALREAARAMHVTVEAAPVKDAAEVPAALAAITRQQPDALVVLADPLTISHRQGIVDFAATRRLPTMYELAVFADAGGLAAYGASVEDLFRRAAGMVDKVLRGVKAGDIPIEQPTVFELVLNLRTARHLGLTPPPAVLVRASRVIE
jgi:putative tryptophan/tyrosine transport system substrate-binding protein